MGTFGSSAILAYALAAAGLALTWLTGRGGYLDPRGRMILSFSSQALVLGGIFLGFAVWQFGVAGGIAVAVAVMWHEWGHVIAYRLAGHDDARFRLIPLFGGVAISDRLPKNQATSCFISLMGPGFSVSLTVLLYIGADLYYDSESDIGYYLYLAAMLCAGLNAFNMLPLWPLDGGRALRLIASAVKPEWGPLATTISSGLLVALAILNHLWILLAFAIMSFASARNRADPEVTLRRMNHREAWLCAVAYFSILCAHLSIGLPLVRGFLHF